MPVLGLGTWKSAPGEVRTAVEAAIDIGFRHLDCAWIYGNEDEVGAAIKNKISQGVVKREDLFITSKLWNTFHRPELAPKCLNETLQKLGVSYLDLYLIHWPVSLKPGDNPAPKDEKGNIIFDTPSVNLKATWGAMEQFVKEGKVRSIGVSNCTRAQIREIESFATVPVCVNQIELHPYFTRKELVNFCAELGIVVTAYSPLGSPDRPASFTRVTDPAPLKDPKILEIAHRHQRSAAQVLIRYHIDSGRVVIPKSVNPERLKQNWQVLEFKLSPEEVKEIDALNKNHRLIYDPFFPDIPHPMTD